MQKLNENNEARVQDISDLNQKNKKIDEDSQEIKLRLAELGHEKEKLVDVVRNLDCLEYSIISLYAPKFQLKELKHQGPKLWNSLD